MVATAANTYILRNQFTFKWNFNIGERSHSETLIYMKTVFSREEKCTCSHNQQRQETKQTSRYMSVFSVIYLHLEKVGKDGEGGGRREGTEKICTRGLPALLLLAIPDLCLWLELLSSVRGPLCQDLGS